MLYIKASITQDDTERAKTELLYQFACARQSGEELICCAFDIDNEKMLPKIYAECAKLLKKMKKEKRISLYLTHETFFGESVEAEYLFSKYPQLREDPFLKSVTKPYFLIRL